MIKAISNTLKRLPGRKFLREFKYNIPGFALLKYYKQRYRHRMFEGPEDIFTHNYENKTWGNEESRSGAGSSKEYTQNIRNKLPELISELNISTILDSPCGDYYWFKLIKWYGSINYIGGDIVKPMIIKNKAQFGSENIDFIDLDIINNTLPDADIWLCRDCFLHLSNHDIFLTMNNFFRSNIEYILLSNYPSCKKNRNTPTGSGRFYNLLLPPFNFPEPLLTIDDWIEGFPVRNLSLWRRNDLYSKLKINKNIA